MKLKKLTREEFNDRINAVNYAKRIFIDSGLTENNITHAFEAYLEIVSETEMPLFISNEVRGNNSYNIMDQFERPKCLVCDTDLLFRTVAENPEGIKTQLVCKNPECDFILNDTHDIKWWMENLKVKKDE
jgi:hypothetical protein